MHICAGDNTSFTGQYHGALMKYAVNDHCAKHRRFPVTTLECILSNNLISSAMASCSGQTFYDPYNLSRDDKEYLMPTNVAEMTSG